MTNEDSPPEIPLSDPECRQCRYSMQGSIDSWQDTIPIDVTCSECGHVMPVRDLYELPLHTVPWLIECAPHDASWFTSGLKTIGTLFFPWRFFSAVRPNTAWCVRQIVFLNLAILIGAVVVSRVGYAVSVSNFYDERYERCMKQVEQYEVDARWRLAVLEGRHADAAMHMVDIGIDPFKDGRLQHEIRKAGERYPIRTPSLQNYPTKERLRQFIKYYDAKEFRLGDSKAQAICTALMFPKDNDVLLALEPMSISPSTKGVFVKATRDVQSFVPTSNPFDFLKRGIDPLILMAICTAVMPGVLLIMFDSRRLSRIGAIHVLRLGWYGCIGLNLVILSYGAFYLVVQAVNPDNAAAVLKCWMWNVFPVWGLWFIAYWLYAIERYLQLKQPLLVILVGAIIACTIAFANAAEHPIYRDRMCTIMQWQPELSLLASLESLTSPGISEYHGRKEHQTHDHDN